MPMIDWSQYPLGDSRAPCPVCSKLSNDKALSITMRAPGEGVAHCHRCGLVELVRNDEELSPARRKAYASMMAALRQQHDADRREQQVRAAGHAATIWMESRPAQPHHPYLMKKGVEAHGIRQQGEALVIPLRDADGVLWSVQRIYPDGRKRFLKDGRITGCYFTMGRLISGLPIVVCEGFATGCSLHQATGYPVAVALNAGNLLPVVLALRSIYPAVPLMLAADDDCERADNPGRTKATEAARAVSAAVVLPYALARDPARNCDFNDLHQLAGLDAVRACFEMEVNPWPQK